MSWKEYKNRRFDQVLQKQADKKTAKTENTSSAECNLPHG